MEISLQMLDEVSRIVRLIDGEHVEILDDHDNIIIKVPKSINGIPGHFVVVIEK